MRKILFVCTGNTCRSPMAELIFNRLAIEKNLDIRAQSAGLCTIDGLLIHDNSKEVLKEIEVESDFFRSKDIGELELSGFERIFAMTPEHRAELLCMGVEAEKISVLDGENGGVSDPYGGSVETYRRCRDRLKALVEELAESV